MEYWSEAADLVIEPHRPIALASKEIRGSGGVQPMHQGRESGLYALDKEVAA